MSENEKPEIPDTPPTDEEIATPRFNVEQIPDVTVYQEFQQWDDEKNRMVTRARGTQHRFSLGHNFAIHIERGSKFQEPKDEPDHKVSWFLNDSTFLALSKGGVNPDRYSPELGVIKVSVPRYCPQDEARKKVVLAVRALIEEIIQKRTQ